MWQLLFLTQHADLEYRIRQARFTELLELAHQYPLYDPHSPQQPPFSPGKDFANKSEAAGFLGKAFVTASFEEIEWTADQHVIAPRFKRLMPHPPPILFIVKLKPDMAAGAGVASNWASPYPVPGVGDPLAALGMVFEFGQRFDWDSAQWGNVPVPGSAGDVGVESAVVNETALGLVEETLTCESAAPKGDDGMVQDMQDVKGLNLTQRCGSAAGNGSGNVIQLADGPRSQVGTGVDVTS